MANRGFGCVYQRKRKLPDGTIATQQTWWIKYSKDGTSYFESSRSNLKNDAERLLKRRLGEVVTGRFSGLEPERIRFRDLAADVVADYSTNARTSLPDVQRRLKNHVLPYFGDIRAAEIGTSMIKQYIAVRLAGQACNATINRELSIIKRAFRLGSQADPPKVIRIPHVPMLRENNVRQGFLEHGAYLRLRHELPEHLRPLLVAGYYTGTRIGELLSLRWTQVDVTANRIVLSPGTTKNREGRTLPIYGELRQWLLIQRDIRERTFPNCPWVFQRDGTQIRSFRKAWEEAAQKAGVPGLLFHDLRRTAVRNMVRAGVPEKVAMQISGHRTRSMFDRYNIVNDRDLQDAALKLDRHLERLVTNSVTDGPNDAASDRPTDPKLLN